MNTNTNERANRLKDIVKKSGMNARKFAINAGIDTSQFNKILNGDLGVSYKIAQKISNKTGIKVEHIISGVEENIPQTIIKLDNETDKSIAMQVLLNISENNKMLSEAALKAVEGSNISAQASLLHAQSISKLTDHSSELMSLVKSTEHAAKEKFLNDDEILISALGRLVVKRMGVEWHSEEEAVSVLSRRVLESLERSGGSHAGVGK